MESDFKDKQRKSYNNMQTVYNVTMGLLILGIGLMMFFNEKIGLNLTEKFGGDSLMIYLFGSLCLLYGGFRLYRGIKKDY
ncbi:MAG TPA: hypothetical protein PLP23_09050 [Panacibacter sp.]|nr:hypothetical protein [Panacibacter sp.]